MDRFMRMLLGFWASVCSFCKKYKGVILTVLVVVIVVFIMGLVSCQGLNVLEGIEGQVVVNSPVDII